MLSIRNQRAKQLSRFKSVKVYNHTHFSCAHMCACVCVHVWCPVCPRYVLRSEQLTYPTKRKNLVVYWARRNKEVLFRFSEGIDSSLNVAYKASMNNTLP